jgi:hypothetical protein
MEGRSRISIDKDRERSGEDAGMNHGDKLVLETLSLEGWHLKCHSILSKALARSSLGRKALSFEDLRLKEWIMSWATMILEAICLP